VLTFPRQPPQASYSQHCTRCKSGLGPQMIE
jgi:hypothetical protein